MSALGTVVLIIGAFLEFLSLDLTMVLVASLFVFVTAEELGNLRAISVYVITAIITFIIAPSKLIAVEYALFAFFPILRHFVMKIKNPFSLLIKMVYIVASALANTLLLKFVFLSDDVWYIEALTAIGFAFCLVLYDVLYTRFSVYYNFKLRKRLRIDRFFNRK